MLLKVAAAAGATVEAPAPLRSEPAGFAAEAAETPVGPDAPLGLFSAFGHEAGQLCLREIIRGRFCFSCRRRARRVLCLCAAAIGGLLKRETCRGPQVRLRVWQPELRAARNIGTPMSRIGRCDYVHPHDAIGFTKPRAACRVVIKTPARGCRILKASRRLVDFLYKAHTARSWQVMEDGKHRGWCRCVTR